MDDIVIGSIVLISDDVHEINAQKAKLQGLYPRRPIFWIYLELCPESKEEVISEWRRLHDHSGI